MDKSIIYTGDTGILVIVAPSPKATIDGKKTSRSMTIEEIAEGSNIPQGIEYEVIETNKILSDCTFRAAWEKGTSDKPIKINMDKARNIHMRRIRDARDKELARLDIEQLKGNDVAAQKQILRDLPDTFDLTVAMTPDELKVLWPECLPSLAE